MSERDLTGHGASPPHPRWPGEARIAVQFVLNIEEGAESCVLNGDVQSEAYLHELPGRPSRKRERDLSVEGMYEYGSRAGVWRVLELFRARDLPLTAARAQAMSRFLDFVQGHEAVWICRREEIAGHWTAEHAAPGGQP